MSSDLFDAGTGALSSFTLLSYSVLKSESLPSTTPIFKTTPEVKKNIYTV